MDHATITPIDGAREWIAAFDWRATPLGDRAQWPAARRCLIDLALRSDRAVAMLWGPAGVVICNDACLDLIGPDHPRPFGLPVTDAFPTLAAASRSVLDHVGRGEALVVSDRELALAHRPPGERRWFDVACTPIAGDHEEVEGVFVVIVETTARVREREAVVAAIRQAQKMEAIGQLTGGMAHDFNNLLAGIIGNLDMLRTRLAQGDINSATSYLAGARSAASRAAGLTQRLLAFSCRQTLQPSAIDVHALLLDIEELLSSTIGPAIALRIECAPAVWRAFCDHDQLENALLNLAINARDAMPHGGCLTIAATNQTLAAPRACETHAAGDHVVLTITDTGCGMADEVAARAFDPFFSTKPRGQGTGLGLSMVYGFLKQSGGHVALESRPGAGTTLRLFIPREPADGALGVDDHAVVPASAETDAVVLVVDDEPDLRSLLAEMLAGLGYAVLQAPDAAAALDIMAASDPIDLLVTDIGLGEAMNGCRLAEAARAMRPGLRVLFITGLTESPAIEPITTEPETDLLRKPFSFTVLEHRVGRLLERADSTFNVTG
jgi:signal transduction histidine kinase/CheY-like chemotaxis protein